MSELVKTKMSCYGVGVEQRGTVFDSMDRLIPGTPF